jgi:predicted phosphoribosyltransferase
VLASPAFTDRAAAGAALARALQRRSLQPPLIVRSGLAALNLKDETVILIDDGLATGSTMLAAIRAARLASGGEITASRNWLIRGRYAALSARANLSSSPTLLADHR